MRKSAERIDFVWRTVHRRIKMRDDDKEKQLWGEAKVSIRRAKAHERDEYERKEY